MRLVDRQEMNERFFCIRIAMNDFCTFNKNQIIFEIDYVKIIVDRSKNEIR